MTSEPFSVSASPRCEGVPSATSTPWPPRPWWTSWGGTSKPTEPPSPPARCSWTWRLEERNSIKLNQTEQNEKDFRGVLNLGNGSVWISSFVWVTDNASEWKEKNWNRYKIKKTLEGSSIWEIEGVELYIQESDFSKEEEKNSCFLFFRLKLIECSSLILKVVV